MGVREPDPVVRRSIGGHLWRELLFVPGSVALVMIVVPALPGPWTKRAEINIGNDI